MYITFKITANGKTFVQGGLSSTAVSTSTKANRKRKGLI